MKKRSFKKLLRRTKAGTNLYEQALFWDRVNDLVLQACLQKWPEPVVDCLLDLLSALHPAYDQRRQFCERYGAKKNERQ